MRTDLVLPRKLTLRALGPDGPQKVVFVKKRQEGIEHVLMKAFLWALYLPAYPDLAIEVPVGDRYKPDLVQLDAFGEPVFWGESGKVGAGKIASLVRRFPATHFAMAKWDAPLAPFVEIVEEAFGALNGSQRPPFDVLRFPPDSADRFITDDGTVTVSFDDIERVRLGA